MPTCPVCRDEFEDDVDVCPTDGVPLVAPEELPPPPLEEASLGVFHPAVAVVVRAIAARREVPTRAVAVDDARVELRVPEAARDALRAELAVHWSSVVAAVPPEQQQDLRGVGHRLVGWHDAPGGAWVDREGRVRVEASPDEEATVDASRRVGPALAAAGVVGLLLAWTGDGSGALWVVSVAALVLGLLLPL